MSPRRSPLIDAMVSRSLRRVRRAAWFIAISCSLLSAPAAATSQPAPRLEARGLAAEAIDLYSAGDFKNALKKFARADQLYPAPTLKLRVARCLDRLNRMHESAQQYRKIIATKLKWTAPRKHHEARKDAVPELAKLLDQMPRVLVLVSGIESEGATVHVDKERIPADRRDRTIDPGMHLFVATKGSRVAKRMVQVQRGRAIRVELQLPDPDDNKPIAPSDDGSAFRIAGWAAIGLGAAGAILGGVTGGMLVAQRSDLQARCPDQACPPEAHDDAKQFNTLRTVSTVGFIVGAVGAGAGITLHLLAPSGNAGEGTPKGAGEDAANSSGLRLRLSPARLDLIGTF